MLSCPRDHNGKGLEAKLNEKLSEAVRRGLCRGSRSVQEALSEVQKLLLSEPAVPGCGQASSFQVWAALAIKPP